MRKTIRPTFPTPTPLEPLIRFGAEHPRFYVEVGKRMTTKRRTRVKRQQVAGWLHPDPNMRQNPTMDSVLRLMQAGDEVKKIMEAEITKP